MVLNGICLLIPVLDGFWAEVLVSSIQLRGRNSKSHIKLSESFGIKLISNLQALVDSRCHVFFWFLLRIWSVPACCHVTPFTRVVSLWLVHKSDFLECRNWCNKNHLFRFILWAAIYSISWSVHPTRFCAVTGNSFCVVFMYLSCHDALIR